MLLGLGIIEGGSYNRADSHPTDEMTVHSKIFSKEWVEQYNADALGCEMGRGRYTWRGCGFGSNVNRKRSLRADG